MNSMPADSNAVLMASTVLIFCDSGTPSVASTLRTDERLTPATRAKSSPDQRSIALAALICAETIDIYRFIIDTISVFIGFQMTQHTSNQLLASLLIHIEGAYAPNTIRAYQADMLEFIQYCSQTCKQAIPADPVTVSDFLMSTSTIGIKNSTVRRKAASISAIHRLLNFADPTKHPEVKITLRKISRQLGNRFDQAYPVTHELLEKLLNVCQEDKRGIRNRALLLLAYDSMRRRSELISLRIKDINWLPNETCCILLRRCKTDQQATGKWIHLNIETTVALKRWLEISQLSEGFILRGITPAGNITSFLCESRIPRIYKSLAKRAGLSEEVISGISGHSMRVGGAQDLLSFGASLPQIMAKGGWSKTDTVMRYVERSSSNHWQLGVQSVRL